MLLIRAAAFMPYFGINRMSATRMNRNANNDPLMFTLILFSPEKYAVYGYNPEMAIIPGIISKNGMNIFVKVGPYTKGNNQ